MMLQIVCFLLAVNLGFPQLFSNVQNCFDRVVSSKKWKQKQSSSFYMDFGDPVIEVFDALSQNDLNRIRTLSDCVKLEYSSMHQLHIPKNDVSNDDYGSNFGGGNRTSLIGLIQRIIPDVIQEIVTETEKSVVDMNWKSIKNLGIRNAQVYSFNASTPIRSLEESIAVKEKQAKERNAFVVTPNDQNDHEMRDIRDELDSLYHELRRDTKNCLKSDSTSIYTLIIPLNDRNNYVGGEVHVEKYAEGESDDENHDDDLYDDDEDEKKEQSRIQFLETDPRHRHLQRNHEIYTPESGSILVIRSEYGHCVEVIRKGFREALVLEYWRNNDVATAQLDRPVKAADIDHSDKEL